MLDVGIKWSTDLPQQDKKLFAVFLLQPHLSAFLLHPAPPYVSSEGLWCFHSGSEKKNEDGIHTSPCMTGLFVLCFVVQVALLDPFDVR